MLSNVGHTIQKMINNTPVSITTNETTTSVVTNGGNVYQTGLIGGKVQYSFREVLSNGNIVGKVIDAAATDDKVYFLNSSGSVFEYDYQKPDCNQIIREVYSPVGCGGDKATKLEAGRAHVLIMTENHKVYGAGSNNQYQLVPQGQCKYDTATEIIITDTNSHDNNCCNTFVGTLSELECPIIPKCEEFCNKISCINNSLCDVFLGYVNISCVTLCPINKQGTLSIPVYGDISYVAFLCVDSKNCATGTLTYTISRLAIKCGCLVAKLTYNDSCGCHVREINVASTKEIVIFEANPCPSAKTDLCAHDGISPITGTSQISGECGSCIIVNIDLPNGLPLPTAAFDSECKTIVLDLHCCRSSLTVLCTGEFGDLSENHLIDIDLDFDVKLNCCDTSKQIHHQTELPQPCWTNIYAGSDTSVLVDECNRLYVLGSIHNVRSNKDLLKRSCLEELLNKANASISFPADQLNCAQKFPRNENCPCPKCREPKFKTDLNKFGIHLSFPNREECDRSMNVCDFLKSLKNCNETPSNDITCEPCDGYIYLNVSGNCGCACGAPTSAEIGSITIFNKKSICKLVSQDCPDLAKVNVDVNTIVEFDLNKYCIDTTDIALDKILKLSFCTEGPNVNIYIDIDQPGGIKFTADGRKCNVEFSVSASTEKHQFILNFGTILDPVELTNLKYALSIGCYYPCPRYKNPFDTKLTNTYIRGGDHIRFITGNPKNIRQAITADVPTVFRLKRRIIDVGVGNNNLSVLVGGLSCPNDIMAIGANCHGELGIGSNESVVCWRQVNQGAFDCQVDAIFSGKNVTFYISRSQKVYASGQWKCFVNSTSPSVISSICPSWKIKEISISLNQIILLGNDGCIFGLGNNSLGELGLCNLECVKKPTPLVFFYQLNSCAAKQLRDNLSHPVERNHNNKKKQNNNNNNGQNYPHNFNNFNNGCGPGPNFNPCSKFEFPDFGGGGCSPCGPNGPVFDTNRFNKFNNNNNNNNNNGNNRRFNPNQRVNKKY